VTRTTTRRRSPVRRSPIAAFALLLVALIVMGLVYSAVSGFSGRADAAAVNSSASQIDTGKQLYLESCSSCHGLAAEGTQNGPTLIGVGAAAVDFQVGTGRMPASYSGGIQVPKKRVQFSDDQVAALAAYIASLSPGPAIPSAADLDYTDASLSAGGELFRTNCAQCHNFAAQGGALTSGKYAPNLTQDTPKHLYEAMLTGPQSMPVFGDATLRPQDKQAIIKYIRTLSTQSNPGGASLGRVGPVTEGLVGWIVGLGSLIGVAVWIGVKAA
jgi:ubiquinol-cytochrome c reductase cytochrome c subunit